MQRSTLTLVTSLACGLALASLVGCESEPGERKDLEAFAQTAVDGDGDEATKKAREADEAKRKKAFEEKKAAEDAEKARVQAIYDEIVKLPDDMPKNVKKACEALPKAYEDFYVNQNAGDDENLLNFYDNKKKTLGERRAKCLKLDNLEAAACQVHALQNAPETGLKGYELELLLQCVEKFAPNAMGDVAAPATGGTAAPAGEGG